AIGPERPAGLDEVAAGRPVVLYGGEDRDGVPPWLEGATVYTASAYSSLAAPTGAGRKLLDALRKKQGRPAGPAGALALDAVRLLETWPDLLANLAKTSDLQKRLKLLNEHPTLGEFDSVAGTMYWKEGRPNRPLFLVRYRGGKETLIRQVQAKP